MNGVLPSVEELGRFMGGPGSPAQMLKMVQQGKRYSAAQASGLNLGLGFREKRALRATRLFLMMHAGWNEEDAAVAAENVVAQVRPLE